MSPSALIGTYAAMAVTFIAVDALWLGVVARGLYQSQLGGFLGGVNWGVALVLYLLLVVGVLVFAVLPALNAGSIALALAYGALFGFLAYATYDLTNLATIPNWPMMISLIDIVWGTALNALIATVGYLVGTALGL